MPRGGKLVGAFHRVCGRERHPASGGHISLFEKEKYGKEKTRLRAQVKKARFALYVGGRADARKCRGGLRGRRWCGKVGEMSRIAAAAVGRVRGISRTDRGSAK